MLERHRMPEERKYIIGLNDGYREGIYRWSDGTDVSICVYNKKHKVERESQCTLWIELKGLFKVNGCGLGYGPEDVSSTVPPSYIA